MVAEPPLEERLLLLPVCGISALFVDFSLHGVWNMKLPMQSKATPPVFDCTECTEQIGCSKSGH